MEFRVADQFEAKTSKGETLTLEPGQTVTLPHDLAIKLLNEQRITPVGRVALKIYSELLDAELWVVATDSEAQALQAEQITDIATYTASEIRELQGKPVDHLQIVNDVKGVFDNSRVISSEHISEGKE